jgi:hypothetical protein
MFLTKSYIFNIFYEDISWYMRKFRINSFIACCFSLPHVNNFFMVSLLFVRPEASFTNADGLGNWRLVTVMNNCLKPPENLRSPMSRKKGPASWSSGQSFWLLITRSRVRFRTLLLGFSLWGRIPVVTMVWVVSRIRLKVEISITRSHKSINSDWIHERDLLVREDLTTSDSQHISSYST